MSSPDGTAKHQAGKLLQTLCNFILPLVQDNGGQTMHAKEIHLGIEADEFVTELEKFVSGMISRSRPRTQDIALDATLEKSEDDQLDNFKGTNRLAIPDDEMIIDAVSAEDENPERIAASTSMLEHHPVHQPMPLSSEDKFLQIFLQDLRRRVTQNMPIRLLCFEPCNGKLKISLLERSEVYNYLAPQLQADYNQRETKSLDFHWTHKANYAILSHTWNPTPGELTYGDWQNGSLDETDPKCQKLINFCKAAWEDHGLTLGWIDTVCINKESSAELDESIRSMYRWYSSARVCITYLVATDTLSNMHADPWFTRGWTLQELIAPNVIKFYDKEWHQLSRAVNDKQNAMMRREIELATTITRNELNAFLRERGRSISISRKMQLAAKRQVTREEDIAYCLMGIFGVSISTAYGEGGDRAFFRLVEEIFRSSKDVSDIFNWAGNQKRFRPYSTTSLFPSHPSDYLTRQEFRPWRPIEPLTFTHFGLRTPILLMCAVPIRASVSKDIHQPIGDYYATVSITPFPDRDGFEVSESYHLLDRRFDGPEGLQKGAFRATKRRKTSTLTFGILNIEKQGLAIAVPKTCLAVLLQSTVELTSQGHAESFSRGYSRIYTEKPIVFTLQTTRNNFDGENEDYYELERAWQLDSNGMKLDTLYL